MSQEMLLIAGLILMGMFAGALITLLVVARDNSLVRLSPDEVVIKRPNPDQVLIQVPPNIARQIFASYGKTDAAPFSTEARGIYAEKYKRAELIAKSTDASATK